MRRDIGKQRNAPGRAGAAAPVAWVTMALVLAWGAGCGGGAAPAVNDVDPETLPGGGVSSGAVLGEINVTVVDGVTDALLAGARVRVGEPADPAPLEAVTGADGVATLRDGTLAGPQTVTAVADGYAPTTWFGANGANVTIQLRLRVEPDPPTAQVSGTIAGWDDLPDPAPGHYRVAYVTYTRSEDFSLPENNLVQPVDGQGRPLNTCLYLPPNVTAPCQWQLTTRTGAQALYAFLLDVDTLGTADRADDVTTLTTYALQTGFDLSADEHRDGVSLALLGASDLAPVTVTLPAPLSGLEEVQVYPTLDLGDEGYAILSVPPLTPDTPTTLLPLPAGVLDGVPYELQAVSVPPDSDAAEGTAIFLRPPAPEGSLVFDDWLPRPTHLSATYPRGTYEFTPVPGATLHSARLEDADGNPIWNVLLLDGRTSFSLPEVTPDPFAVSPTDDATLIVSAMVLPGFDPLDFSGDALGDTITHSCRTSLVLSP